MLAMTWLANANGATRLARAYFLVLSLLGSIPCRYAAILSNEAVAGSCLTSSYSWAYNSQGLTPCQVEAELMQTCNNSAGVVYPCICNSMGYSLWAACSLCIEQSPHSFSIYLSDAHCPQLYDALSSNGVDVPGWANLPLIDDETFNVQAAEQAASPQSSSIPATKTNDTPAQTSESNSSAQPSVSPIAKGISGSLPDNGAQTAGTSQSTVPPGPSSGPRTSGVLTETGQSPSGSMTSQSSYPSMDSPTSFTHTPSSPGSTQSAGARVSSRSSVIGGVVGSAITVVIIITVGCLARRWRRRGSFRAFGAESPGCEPLQVGADNRREKTEVEEGLAGVGADSHSAIQPAGENPFAPTSYTMKVYDPDDPSTYPPRLADLQGRLPLRLPVNPSSAPEIYEVC
ncbi:hypothetical protein C8Q73DRAFT_503725 [Cubamyces lactineus]|nr:hypothetical protein C8Q73DRAFT_503725 [Cubamyces lactineus]